MRVVPSSQTFTSEDTAKKMTNMLESGLLLYPENTCFVTVVPFYFDVFIRHLLKSDKAEVGVRFVASI